MRLRLTFRENGDIVVASGGLFGTRDATYVCIVADVVIVSGVGDGGRVTHVDCFTEIYVRVVEDV